MHITLCQLSRKEWAVATARGDAGFDVDVAARELNVELLEQACRNHMCIWFQCLHLSILQARAAFDMENTVRVKVDPYTTAPPPPPPPGGFPLCFPSFRFVRSCVAGKGKSKHKTKAGKGKGSGKGKHKTRGWSQWQKSSWR